MIEFDEKTHTYLVDGVLTPSVTQLIQKIWMPDMYSGVPSAVLAKKAMYGNKVHEMIESYTMDGTLPDWYDKRSFEGIAMRRFQRLQEDYKIECLESEKCVCYMKDDEALYAGKYDMLGTVNNKPALIDIKTTVKYNAKYLSYQLTLYKMAIEQTEHVKIEEAYCLWLPKKDLGNLIKVDLLNEDELINDVETYEKEHSAS